MLTAVLRTALLYAVLIICIRLMGKRQVGQLQPSELVITILISELAAMPIADTSQPVWISVVCVLLLASFEVTISCISMKSLRFRTAVQGNSVIIIRDGKLDTAQMKKLRYTTDDILEALRKKDVFNIEDVRYAIAETDGSLSVMLKPGLQPATRRELGIKATDDGLPCVVISDGQVILSDLSECDLTPEQLPDILRKKGINPKKIMLMTLTASGKQNVIKKDEKK